jgi:predicted SAM-dependent methyltransferase
MRQLLIGCGNRRVRRLSFGGFDWDDLVTIDHDPNCGADIVHDLEVLPWPVEADSFDEVHAYEVLEHLGTQGNARSFFAHFGEIYRVLKPGGMLMATVPAWDDVWAWADPSHRRVISQGTLMFLDQTEYVHQVGKTAMTDFRWLWSGDFELTAAETENGCFKFALTAHKPARY